MDRSGSAQWRIEGIGRIVLAVRDLERSRQFYASLLAPTRRDSPEPDRGACEVAEPTGDFGVRLREGLAPVTEPAIEHFYLRADSLAALRRLHARAGELCADVTDLRRVNGEWRFYMYDPDGHKIGVYARQDPSSNDASVAN
jgi:catechol 2,3-dioxygenase-like lactoylglutathione lyase family enzyme